MARPSFRQTEALIRFMEAHKDFALGLLKTPDGRVICETLWAKLTNQLNSIGGCLKTKSVWKKYWNDKKSNVKKAAAKRSLVAKYRGENNPSMTPSPHDVRILKLLGEDINEGSNRVHSEESGQPQPSITVDVEENANVETAGNDLAAENDFPGADSPSSSEDSIMVGAGDGFEVPIEVSLSEVETKPFITIQPIQQRKKSIRFTPRMKRVQGGYKTTNSLKSSSGWNAPIEYLLKLEQRRIAVEERQAAAAERRADAAEQHAAALENITSALSTQVESQAKMLDLLNRVTQGLLKATEALTCGNVNVNNVVS